MTGLSTTNVRASDVVPYWTDVVCRTYVPVECDIEDKRPFFAQIQATDLVRAHLSRVVSAPVRYQRTPRNIAEFASDDYLVKLITKGQAHIEQSGQSAHIGPGDLCLFDTSRPYKLRFPEPYEAVMLKIPRAELDYRLPVAESVTAMRVPAEGRFARLAATMLTSTCNFLDDGEQIKRIAPNLVDLVSLAFDECFSDFLSGDLRYARIVSRAKDVIHQNLFDPDFDATSVAHEIGVSPRTLNRAFAQQNITPVRWLWSKRVEAARDMLDSCPQVSVSDVAMKCGFNNFSHFSRVFKARYGVTASSMLTRT